MNMKIHQKEKVYKLSQKLFTEFKIVLKISIETIEKRQLMLVYLTCSAIQKEGIIMINQQRITDLLYRNNDVLVHEYAENNIENSANAASGEYTYSSYDIDLTTLDGYQKSDDIPENLTIPLSTQSGYTLYDWIYEEINNGDVDPEFLEEGYTLEKDYDSDDKNDIDELCAHINWDAVRNDMIKECFKEYEEDFYQKVNEQIRRENIS